MSTRTSWTDTACSTGTSWTDTACSTGTSLYPLGQHQDVPVPTRAAPGRPGLPAENKDVLDHPLRTRTSWIFSGQHQDVLDLLWAAPGRPFAQSGDSAKVAILLNSRESGDSAQFSRKWSLQNMGRPGLKVVKSGPRSDVIAKVTKVQESPESSLLHPSRSPEYHHFCHFCTLLRKRPVPGLVSGPDFYVTIKRARIPDVVADFCTRAVQTEIN